MSCQVLRGFFRLLLILALVATGAFAADISSAVEKILRDIRQDQPVPDLDYLNRVEPVNVDCASFRGSYQGMEIFVETHPKNNLAASVLLQIPGADQTQKILSAVINVIGPPHYREPEKSHFAWDWGNYRSASLHYIEGNKTDEGFTIVSLFYR